MKRIGKFLIAICLVLIISGCGVGNVTNKTEYLVGEEATIDHFLITANNYEVMPTYNGNSSKNGTFVKVNYTITNNSSSSIDLSNVKKYFKAMDVNGNLIDASYGDIVVIEKGSTIESYNVIFDVPSADSYKILFYSNVVSNNIAFELK